MKTAPAARCKRLARRAGERGRQIASCWAWCSPLLVFAAGSAMVLRGQVLAPRQTAAPCCRHEW